MDVHVCAWVCKSPHLRTEATSHGLPYTSWFGRSPKQHALERHKLYWRNKAFWQVAQNHSDGTQNREALEYSPSGEWHRVSGCGWYQTEATWPKLQACAIPRTSKLHNTKKAVAHDELLLSIGGRHTTIGHLDCGFCGCVTGDSQLRSRRYWISEGTEHRWSRWQNQAWICFGDAKWTSRRGCHPGGRILQISMRGHQPEWRLMSKFSVCILEHTKQPCNDDEAFAEAGARRSALHSRSNNRLHGTNNMYRKEKQKFAQKQSDKNGAGILVTGATRTLQQKQTIAQHAIAAVTCPQWKPAHNTHKTEGGEEVGRKIGEVREGTQRRTSGDNRAVWRNVQQSVSEFNARGVQLQRRKKHWDPAECRCFPMQYRNACVHGNSCHILCFRNGNYFTCPHIGP